MSTQSAGWESWKEPLAWHIFSNEVDPSGSPFVENPGPHCQTALSL